MCITTGNYNANSQAFQYNVSLFISLLRLSVYQALRWLLTAFEKETAAVVFYPRGPQHI